MYLFSRIFTLLPPNALAPASVDVTRRQMDGQVFLGLSSNVRLDGVDMQRPAAFTPLQQSFEGLL